jgi:hypothetical protein
LISSLRNTLILSAIALAAATAPVASGAARVGDAVSAYMGQVTKASAGRSVVRWGRKVCISVAGLPQATAQVMNDRIATVAVNAGLDTADAGCKPNILIIVTKDAHAAAADALKANAELFSHNDQGRPAGRDDVRRFTESTKPVRWWRYSRPLTMMGDSGGIGVATRGGSPRAFTTNGVMVVPLRVLVIVDITAAKDVSFPALCDYVAMVALAEVDPDAKVTALPSILTLFDDRIAGETQPSGLSDWDARYLKALYGVNFGPTDDSQRERAAIADAMRADAGPRAASSPTSGPGPNPQ